MSNRQRFRRSRGYSDRRVACEEPLPSAPAAHEGHLRVLVGIGVGLALGLTLGMVFLAR